MPAKTLALPLLALLAACGSGSGTTDSSTTGSGGSTATGSSSATTGSGGAGGGCAIDPKFAEVLAKPLSGCAGFEPPCHNDQSGMLHIDPADANGTWGALVKVDAAIVGAGKRVVPGDPAHSFLYRKLINDLKPDDGVPMPKSGLATGWSKLPADQIEMLRCWILAGAKNN